MNSVDLLHPELLSADTLLQILLERKVKIEGVESMNKEQLLDIYIKFCLPRTQRKSRDNGRTRIIENLSQNVDDSINKSTDTFYKCSVDSYLDNETMECDKFPCTKRKYNCIGTADRNDDFESAAGCKRKISCNVEYKSVFEITANCKRQRTHTG